MDKAAPEKYVSAARQALKAFPVTPDAVELVWQSENITFRVRDGATGSDYVLRLHRPGYHTLSELNSERAWTEALEAAGIAAQTALLTRSGEHFHTIDIPGEAERLVGMTRWVEGTLLCDYMDVSSDLEEKKRSFGQIGALAAAIHNQSSGWDIPQDFERHKLDIDGLMGEVPFWGRFWEHPKLSAAERELLNSTRNKLRDVLQAYGQNPSTYGIIHADLHSENVLVHDGNVVPIDFDDAGFGWHMYEVAVALFDEQFKPDFETITAALVDGYRAHRALRDADLALLPTFLLVRGLAIIGWFGQRPEHDGSEFFDGLKAALCQQCEAFQPGL